MSVTSGAGPSHTRRASIQALICPTSRAFMNCISCTHDELAQRLDEELVGRNVIAGRWTFQIVEDYDDHYYSAFTGLEREVREQLVQGRRHVHEAEMKESHRTHGRRHHEARPDLAPSPEGASS